MLLPYSNGFRVDRDRSGAEHPYIHETLKTIYAVRRYGYQFHDMEFTPEYPVYFRQHREFILDNRRHETIDCDIYDADPLVNDMSVMTITGTGLGVDYKGQWNTVSHCTHFGSFRGEKNAQGDYPEIIRKSVKDFPEHGKILLKRSPVILTNNNYCS